ncbi:MAG: protein kinase [Desulfobacteraceae bacterium]|nr:protein kinase [Desulfobacteraceae bacterium]
MSTLQILEEGQLVHEKWEIIKLLARGGKGEVYLARQVNLNRQVALKVMSKEFINSLEGREEEYESELQRFRREVQVMASIRHPNVLQVYDFDQVQANDNCLDYIVMEYIPGPTLRQTMPSEGFKQDEQAVVGWINKYFLSMLHGMEAVHAMGVVHRDMKPENVLIDEGIPKISDFGLAGGHQLDGITRSYHVIGTPPYMPEEQFLDLAATDARTDIYSLGKILYEVIEGKMTQDRNKPFTTVHLDSPSTGVLFQLDKVIRNATAKDQNQRTSSVKALRKELEEIIQESAYAETMSTTKRHRKQILLISGIAAALLLLLAATFGGHLLNMESDQAENHKNTTSAVSSTEIFDFDFKSGNPTQIPDVSPEAALPEKMLGSDGMTLRLIPGGEARVFIDQPGAPDRRRAEGSETVNSFYMDETKITNHMYVEFLHNIQDLVVKDNTVRKNGQIWLVLGEVLEGYEPIVFKDGGFRIKPGTASNPVVRVTPVGAMAYARFYGRTLPAMAQWRRAIQAEKETSQIVNPADSRVDNGMMHHLSQSQRSEQKNSENLRIRSVTAFESNRFGVLGLGRNVNEWTVYRPSEKDIEFHIHGGLGELGRQKAYLQRQPWEAFANVGFRTVINLPSKEQ